MSKVPAQRKWL